MSRPKLLDLFCGAGGAAMGYSRAGFDVVGVDIKPQPRYPFPFFQGDALTFPPEGFDAIHASPPCQAFSTIAKQQRTRAAYDHPDLVDATRRRLKGSGLPFVIENVMGAPLKGAVVLCGSSFNLDVRRHRLFECSFGILAPPCVHHHQTPRFRTLDRRRLDATGVVAVYGTGSKQAPIASVVGVHGQVNYSGERELRERAMGIDWMNPYELTQAIPPAYTEFIGRQLIEALGQESRVTA